jgi:NAD-dependent deacetylase
MTHTASLERLRRLIDEAERIVFFTGAGISTESGIPDFRSPGTGLWNKIKPIQFQDFVASEDVRQESWRRRFTGERPMERARPNTGHRAVARLVELGKAIAVITQNVDNLHQDSGVPDDRSSSCTATPATRPACRARCATRWPISRRSSSATSASTPARAAAASSNPPPSPSARPCPRRPWPAPRAAIEACDLCIVVGSSLVVYPAAGFPEYAKRRGAGLAIVNREETPSTRSPT